MTAAPNPLQDPIDILLVDDEPRNLDALEAILDNQGYHLLRAGDADLALRLLLEHDVAAIVLDIKMPRVNGIELAQIIKGTKRFREIPILFLTAHLVEDQDIVAGYGAGAVDYMTKPFNPTILRHKIGVFADLFRKSRALTELNDRLEHRVAERTSELEQSEKALRQAARQKDEFLATLAHELRNPLAPLRTGLDLLMQLQGESTNAVQNRTLAAMNRQLDHIVRLIDDLLDVSRISRGVLELKKEKTNLAMLVHAAADTFRPLFEQKGVRLVVGHTASISAQVDPTRISQILGNLLHNAMKFTPRGGTVRMELEHVGGDAIACVSDTGVGVPADQIERIFEMFARVDRHQGNHADRGAGIGLALAKRLAQMHGGDLTARSAGEGHGTTFTLGLPSADVAPIPVENAPRGKVVKAGAIAILLVEDNPDVADTLAAWLEENGHAVTLARSGEEALEVLQKPGAARPQLVLCDLGLPGIDGIEVCKRMRGMPLIGGPQGATIVALTGWGKDEDRQRTKAAGFDHHLVKPVALDRLSELIRSVAVPGGLPS